MSTATYENCRNGNENVTFITKEMGSKSKQKKTGLIVGSVLVLLVLAAVAGFLIWWFAVKPSVQKMAATVEAQKDMGTRVFSGEMTLIDATYKREYEDPSSKEFQETADALQGIVSFCDFTPVLVSDEPSSTC
ncbi:hypothetical protein AMELA_G00104900 [Ameiurus melas]|uniref:SEA domain-containing protein n=1 Tax=Ameiurus melas TaxID=219545 RepID=A0A7J6AUJ1_AMEME|nr:hypothetical protein AMELA_G00104900 [Ameiurus melas]